jgi:PKD repeat protein
MSRSIAIRLCLLALAAAALVLGAPTLASAQDYCVGSPTGCTGMPEGTDLQQALTDAKNHSGADRVLIGPGLYSAPAGFNYVDGAVANTVDIEGVGSTQPTITLTGTAGQDKALTLSQPGSTVSNLHLDVPDNPNFSLFGLGMSNASAHDLTITTPDPSTQLQTGAQVSGGTISHSTITAQINFGIGVDARNGATVEDNTILAGRGVETFGTNIQISRNKISSNFKGLSIQGGTGINVDNNLVDVRGGKGTASYGMYVSTTPSTLTGTINASQLTIRNGNSNTIGVQEESGNSNAAITINLTDSIIRDVGHSTVLTAPPASGTFALNADHDDYDTSTDLPASLVPGQTRNETNILANVDPLFLNPVSGVNGITGDYRLANNSPVIDAGDSASLGTGETDLRGLSRIVAGLAPYTTPVRDLGAYEYQHAAPTAVATAAPGAATTGQTINFDGSGSSDLDGGSLTYAWSFDDGGTATGAAVTHAFASAGSHTGTLTVTDDTGLTGTAIATATVTTPPTTSPPVTTKKCKKKKHRAASAKKCKKKKKKS